MYYNQKIETMITATKIKTILAKIKLAVEQIEKEENVKIDFSNSQYTSAFFQTKMKVTTNEKNEKVDCAYKSICMTLGFTQNIIGMQFNGAYGLCEIIDVVTRNRKYPVIAKCENGKKYKYSVSNIKALIGGDKVINRNKNLENLIG